MDGFVTVSFFSTYDMRIAAERSGYNIIFDQPEITTGSILEIVHSTTSSLELPQKEVTLT